MLRNQREERLKFIRREQVRLEELREQAWAKHYIPLEKPQHAGWECYVELSESGKKRRDAAQITAILDLLGWNDPHFIRNLNTIRVLRMSNYSYSIARGEFIKKRSRGHQLDYFYQSHRLYESQYTALNPEYQAFFHLDKREYEAAPWRGKHYYLNWGVLPIYELVFKVRKAYWTHIAITDGAAESDYDRLRAKMYSGSYKNDASKAGEWDNRYRDDFRNMIKCSWRGAIKKIKDAANTVGVDSEDWDDVETYLKTKAGVYSKKPFGWD